MLLIRTEARRGLRWGVFSSACCVALLALSNNPAAAAPYADIVVDANTGAVLRQSNPDAKRHPASLTKIMTLYLLFEQLEAGKLKLDSQLKVSQFAAEQSPTKLGLKAGSTIQVEDAIKGIITRSANDASVVVAEAIAGSETDFAVLMTKKAKSLGMANTLYRNASGLPDTEQVTTARDQSMLGRAIQERFPKYYKYFQTRSFSFRGQTIGNHNNLLGRVEGVDGIKTGYIRASGFNLVTSVHRGNRYLVAVVMGGSSAGSRDARMRELISETIKTASTKQTTTMLAELREKQGGKAEAKAEPKVVAQADSKSEAKAVARVEAKAEAKAEAKSEAKPDGKDQQRYAIASSTSTPVRLAAGPAAKAQRSAPGSDEPIRPVLVKTVAVKPGALQTAVIPSQVTLPMPSATTSVSETAPQAAPAVQKIETTTVEGKADVAKPEVVKPEIIKPELIKAEVAKAEVAKIETPKAAAPTPNNKTETPKVAAPAAAKVETLKVAATPAKTEAPKVAAAAPAKTEAPKVAEVPSPRPAARAAAEATPPARQAAATPASARPTTRSGWMIQVGAFTAEQEAKQRLSSIKTKAPQAVDGTDPFTESVEKGGSTFYRARFAGFDKDKAEAACKVIKRDGVECVTIKN